MFFFFFNQKTAYEMRICDWISDVCSSDLGFRIVAAHPDAGRDPARKAQKPAVLVARRRAGLARDGATDLRRPARPGVHRGLQKVGDPGGNPMIDERRPEIRRATGRARVCTYVEIPGEAG